MSKEKKVEKGEVVKVREKVTVYATGAGNGGFLKKGKALNIHPLLAKKLIEAGKATEKQPKE